MEERYIVWMLNILPLISALLTILLFYELRTACRPQQLVLKTYRELSGLLAERGKKVSGTGERRNGFGKRERHFTAERI